MNSIRCAQHVLLRRGTFQSFPCRINRSFSASALALKRRSGTKRNSPKAGIDEKLDRVPGSGVLRKENSLEKSLAHPSNSSLEKPGVPEIYSQLLAIPVTKSLFFPGFYKAIAIKDIKAIQAVQSLLERRQPYIGLFLSKNDDSQKDLIDNIDDVHRVGVFAQITDTYQTGPDNSELTIVVYLHRRIRILDLVNNHEEHLEEETEKNKLGYEVVNLPLATMDIPVVNVENVRDEPYNESNDLIKALKSQILNVLREIGKYNHLFRDQIVSISSSWGPQLRDPSRLADFAAAFTSANPHELQEILESIVVEEKLHKSLVAVQKELSNAQLQHQITSDVEKKISKKQREYYLMEQLKGIKKELGMESDGKERLVEKFKEKASKLSMPEPIRKVFQEELNKLQGLEPVAAEFNVTRNYLDWLTQIPWGKTSDENYDMNHATCVLDEDHYGLKDVKDRILEFISVGKLRGTVEGRIITLVGPPGVGKTSVGKSIARALGREFYRFSVGGLTDVAEIKGHRRTYVGAMPGKVVQALKTVQTSNPLVMIDEIDKLGRGHQGDPASALLELLDPEQNHAFLDHYMDVPLDLSKVLFVCTANATDTIPGPLLDRMEVIQISGYVAEEKTAIAQKYLTPVSKKECGLEEYDVTITDKATQLLIRQYCRESGVRNLRKHIDKIFRKAAYNIVSHNWDKNKPLLIDEQNLKEFVGSPVYLSDRLYDETPTGVVMGLAWTQMGGTSLFVESVLEAPVSAKSKASFHYTGQMGDVMKESANIAYTYVRSFFAKYFPEDDFFEKARIHLHVPEGATPKDGPSAGCTMASSLISLALNKKVIRDVAMTGELTLTGKILKIGGVKEKTIAAKRSGVKIIIFPESNRSDWDELPGYVKEGLEPVFVTWFDEIFHVIFPNSDVTV